MYEPTLTPRTDAAPVPRVEIVFTSVADGTETATVFRVTDDRTYRVRGGIGVYAAGGFAVVDTEAPFGVQVAYRAEMFNAAGLSLGFTDLATVILDAVGSWIHQPLDPSRNTDLLALMGTAADLVRPFLGELVQPQGRSVPVWVGAGRTGLRGVPLLALTETAEQEQGLRSVFGGYEDRQLPVVCFRSSLPLGLPQPFFGVVVEPRRLDVDTNQGGEALQWQLTADEAAAPAEALAAGVLTYADLEASYATYADLEAAYLTYLDMESDFSLAGVAG